MVKENLQNGEHIMFSKSCLLYDDGTYFVIDIAVHCIVARVLGERAHFVPQIVFVCVAVPQLSHRFSAALRVQLPASCYFYYSGNKIKFIMTQDLYSKIAERLSASGSGTNADYSKSPMYKLRAKFNIVSYALSIA